MSLPEATERNQLSDPSEVTWDDIETYEGNFEAMELRYLTARARLAQMRQDPHRHRELSCTLDYLHFLILQGRSGEVRRELPRLANHPGLLSSTVLYARHQVLFAVAQNDSPQGCKQAERIINSLLSYGDKLPLDAQCRAKIEYAERHAERHDTDMALRLSTSAIATAVASEDEHLLSIAERGRVAILIDVGEFRAAEAALEYFPEHTPLFTVQKVFTYADLLHKSGSLTEAITYYTEAARLASANGMMSYARHFSKLAVSLCK
ncbi:MAG: hypothetical protein EOP06_09010 [Proteobacteria bacterium]|nr:MAG: hypothetical protein EOP06_09010 [Pseudomonadota bacterium]